MVFMIFMILNFTLIADTANISSNLAYIQALRLCKDYVSVFFSCVLSPCVNPVWEESDGADYNAEYWFSQLLVVLNFRINVACTSELSKLSQLYIWSTWCSRGQLKPSSRFERRMPHPHGWGAPAGWGSPAASTRAAARTWERWGGRHYTVTVLCVGESLSSWGRALNWNCFFKKNQGNLIITYEEICTVWSCWQDIMGKRQNLF